LLAYDDVPAHLIPWAKKTMLAHLYKLNDEGRARMIAAGQASQRGQPDVETMIWEAL
jgi:hypothetical protein